MQQYAIPAILFTLFLILYTPACKHDPDVLIVPDPTDTTQTGNPTGPGNPSNPGTSSGVPCDPDTVYFQNQILPLLISNCTQSGCHNEADRQDGVVLTSYQRVMSTVDDITSHDWDDNELVEVLLEDDPDKRMPYGKAPLSAAQINLIKTWILQGNRNNGCNENAGACETAGTRYSTFIQPLIQARCQGCHSGSAPQGGINLSTYQNVKTLAQNGRLYGAVTRTTNWMPKGGAKLDDCTLAKMKAWIDAGAPNN